VFLTEIKQQRASEDCNFELCTHALILLGCIFVENKNRKFMYYFDQHILEKQPTVVDCFVEGKVSFLIFLKNTLF
jgi:hypothetical protein